MQSRRNPQASTKDETKTEASKASRIDPKLGSFTKQRDCKSTVWLGKNKDLEDVLSSEQSENTKSNPTHAQQANGCLLSIDKTHVAAKGEDKEAPTSSHASYLLAGSKVPLKTNDLIQRTSRTSGGGVRRAKAR